MVLIVKGILIILVFKLLSDALNLYTVGVLLEYVFEWGPLALIVLFQPELRSFLETIGRTKLLGRHKVLTVEEREKVVYEIMDAIEYLKKNKIADEYNIYQCPYCKKFHIGHYSENHKGEDE
jgi:DNA integrity scanning protein DisA with diadenylate cyclase activity